jgi:hypothetical protein
MRKMNEKDREYLVFDEMPRVQPCLLAAVDNAEGQEVNYYGLLSPHFYYIIESGMINTCIDRSGFTAIRIRIRSLLSRMKVFEPRDEYRCE